jgi:hypothetical protein
MVFHRQDMIAALERQPRLRRAEPRNASPSKTIAPPSSPGTVRPIHALAVFHLAAHADHRGMALV